MSVTTVSVLAPATATNSPVPGTATSVPATGNDVRHPPPTTGALRAADPGTLWVALGMRAVFPLPLPDVFAIPASVNSSSTFPSASYRNPPRGQKSQQSEQPVHIFTSVGMSSAPIPSESEGQAAMQAPHSMQRPASMTARSSSQNQTLPGASSMSFI